MQRYKFCILKANADSGCQSCWAAEKLKSSQICDSQSRFSEEEKSEKPSQCRTLFDRAFCVRSATCTSVHWKLFNEVHSVHSTHRMAPSEPGQQLLLSSEIYLQISNFVQTLKFKVWSSASKTQTPFTNSKSCNSEDKRMIWRSSHKPDHSQIPVAKS